MQTQAPEQTGIGDGAEASPEGDVDTALPAVALGPAPVPGADDPAGPPPPAAGGESAGSFGESDGGGVDAEPSGGGDGYGEVAASSEAVADGGDPDQEPGSAPNGIEGEDAPGAVPLRFAPEPFGKYHLIDRIAVGGMAEVFVAKTFGIGGFEKKLVIKRILPSLSASDEFVRMFIDEAKLSVLLTHTNIVQVYDFGRIGDHFFIAMEAVDGRDLKTVWRRLAETGERFDPRLAVFVAWEAARGLDYAHRKRDDEGRELHIVHRDVSPSNVLVSYEGAVKLADFGIAKARLTTEDTQQGVLKGKFEYMSPEQAWGRATDRRSDVFSLGTVLWEMLTGDRLFKGESDLDTLERIRVAEVPPPREIRPELPPAIEKVVLKALAFDVEDRYPDAGTFAAALRDLLLPGSPEDLAEPLGAWLTRLFAVDMRADRERLERASEEAHGVLDLEDDLDLEEGGPPAEEPDLALVPNDGGIPAAAVASGAATLPLTASVPPSPVPAILDPVSAAAARAYAPPIRAGESVDARLTRATDVPPSRTPWIVAAAALLALLALALWWFSVPRGTSAAPEGIEVSRAPAEEPVERVAVATPLAEPPASAVAAAEAVTLPDEAPRTDDAARRRPPPRDDRALAVLAPPSPVAADAKGTVVLESRPSGAEVRINGRAVGRTPYQFNTGEPGQGYAISLSMDGHDAEDFSVDFPKSGTHRVSRTLSVRTSAPPGTLNVRVNGGFAELFVDGKPQGRAPRSLQLPPGSYQVRLVNAAANFDRTVSVTLRSGQTARVSETLGE